MCKNNSCGCSTSKPQSCGCKKSKMDILYNPICATPSRSSCFDEPDCDDETFDFKQIRYKVGCDDYSNLENLGIGVGDNLEFTIEKIAEYIQNFSFLETPSIPNMPTLNTFEKIILYQFAKIQDLQEQINVLKNV